MRRKPWEPQCMGTNKHDSFLAIASTQTSSYRKCNCTSLVSGLSTRRHRQGRAFAVFRPRALFRHGWFGSIFIPIPQRRIYFLVVSMPLRWYGCHRLTRSGGIAAVQGQGDISTAGYIWAGGWCGGIGAVPPQPSTLYGHFDTRLVNLPPISSS